MTPPRPLPAESPPAASGPESPLDRALQLVDEWAGGALALIVGGSHAAGTAVWVALEPRRVCLSDLDVYAVVPDRRAQRAAGARARADRRGLRERLLAWDLAAPLEAAFLVPDDLARLPARPATLELAQRGRVVKGDPAWRQRVPAWRPSDVSTEEIRLLHENRACELLLAWPALDAPALLPRLQARHAVLKCALDVVRVRALARGEYPDGVEALAAWAAGAAGAGPDDPQPTRSLIAAAQDWRAGRAVALAPAAARQEWRAVAGTWTEVWRQWWGPAYDDALRSARRARLRRRLRRAVSWPTRSGCGPGLPARLRWALRGTPQHRVGASAAVLLLAATATGGAGAEPVLPAPARRALAALGVAGAAARGDWPSAALAVARAWDRWVLDGQRTEEPA